MYRLKNTKLFSSLEIFDKSIHMHNTGVKDKKSKREKRYANHELPLTQQTLPL